jgi:hypothetical protein
MAITVADNFSYQGKKPLDGRDTFATLAAMKAYAEASVYDGCLSYCDEDGKRYEFKSTNTVDPTTGKWREYSSGGGGQTYNDFTGATASTAGAHGLVPAPSAGDDGRVLFGNGTWGALINSPNELPVLFDERGTEYQVGWYVNGSGLKKPVYEKVITGTIFGAIPMNWTNIVSIADADFLIDGDVLRTYDHSIHHETALRIENGILQYFCYEGQTTGTGIWAFDAAIIRYIKTTDTWQ